MVVPFRSNTLVSALVIYYHFKISFVIKQVKFSTDYFDLLEFQLGLETVPSEEWSDILNLPHRHFTVTIIVGSRPLAVIQLRASIIRRKMFEFPRRLSRLVEPDSQFDPNFLEVIEIRRPSVLQRFEPRLVQIRFLRFVESRQVFDGKLAGVEDLLVGIRSEQGSVGELVSLPVSACRPDPAVAQNQSERLSDHLVLGQRFIGNSFAGINLFGIGYLEEDTDEVGQSEGHSGFVFEKLLRTEHHAAVELEIFGLVVFTNVFVHSQDEVEYSMYVELGLAKA